MFKVPTQTIDIFATIVCVVWLPVLLLICSGILPILVVQHSVDPCADLFCDAPFKCVVGDVTGNAYCVPDCTVDNGGCPADEICEVETYDCASSIGPPCDPYSYANCRDAPYGKRITMISPGVTNPSPHPPLISPSGVVLIS